MSTSLLSLTDQTFDAHITGASLPILVDFWASWCGPCINLMPTLEKLAETLQGKVEVVKVNVDENPQKPSQYQVTSLPTLILFHKGTMLGRVMGGGRDVKTLTQWIEGLVG